MKNKLSVILLTFFFCSSISSQTVVGKYAGEFLSFGVGGKALAMGSAQVALTNDVTAGYWNPAGLARIDYPQISLMHEEHFGNLANFNYGAIAIPYQKDMSFALSIIRVSVDGIPDTRNALYDSNGDGIIDFLTGDNIDPDKVKDISNADWAFYFSFAKKYSDNLYWGANVKIIRRDIAEFGATGIGFDIGAVYIPFENLSIGANFMDATTTLVAWSTGRNELITPTLKIGAAYKMFLLGGEITPAFDVDMRFENRRFASNLNIGPVSMDFHGGFEYNYNNIFAVRGGYNDLNQFTIGAGIKLPKLNIDYSYAKMNGKTNEVLDATHRISLILTLEEDKYKRN